MSKSQSWSKMVGTKTQTISFYHIESTKEQWKCKHELSLAHHISTTIRSNAYQSLLPSNWTLGARAKVRKSLPGLVSHLTNRGRWSAVRWTKIHQTYIPNSQEHKSQSNAPCGPPAKVGNCDSLCGNASTEWATGAPFNNHMLYMFRCNCSNLWIH